ncbi:hypothetical protein BHE74_00033201 [Ensete ventricosum]|nr:hypothetical protein BHE74_00033201 [Ensete ventricosum]
MGNVGIMREATNPRVRIANGGERPRALDPLLRVVSDNGTTRPDGVRPHMRVVGEEEIASPRVRKETIDLPPMLGFFGIFLIWFAIDAVAFEDEGDVDLGLAAFALFLTGVALVMLHAWIAVDPDNRRRRARDLALAAAGAALRPLLLDLARGELGVDTDV